MMAFLTTWMRKNMIWFVRVVLFLHLSKDDPKVFVVVKTVEDGSWTESQIKLARFIQKNDANSVH
jgi:hypothetical protein